MAASKPAPVVAHRQHFTLARDLDLGRFDVNFKALPIRIGAPV